MSVEEYLKCSSKHSINMLHVLTSTCNSYRHKHKDSKADMKLRKVYFYWVCPDTNSFEWINDLLKNFDQQMAEEGLGEFLNYYIYLTRGWDKNQVCKNNEIDTTYLRKSVMLTFKNGCV